MKHNRYIFSHASIPHLLIAVLIAFTAVACGSQKKIVDSATPASSKSAPALNSNSDLTRQLGAIVGSYGSWEKLRLPVTVELNQPKNISISGTAFMERGKSVMIMLKYFGFEVGSLYLTNDSILVIDKVHKSYAGESVRKFLGGFDVNISNVQDLLLGRAFVIGKSGLTSADLAGADMELISPQEWLLIPKKTSPSIEYGFRFSPADILYALICQTGSNPPVNCLYAPAVNTIAGPMSPEIRVSYVKGKTSVDAALQWNFPKAKWNDEVELRVPAVGKDYKVISSSDISKIVSKL